MHGDEIDYILKFKHINGHGIQPILYSVFQSNVFFLNTLDFYQITDYKATAGPHFIVLS